MRVRACVVDHGEGAAGGATTGCQEACGVRGGAGGRPPLTVVAVVRAGPSPLCQGAHRALDMAGRLFWTGVVPRGLHTRHRGHSLRTLQLAPPTPPPSATSLTAVDPSGQRFGSLWTSEVGRQAVPEIEARVLGGDGRGPVRGRLHPLGHPTPPQSNSERVFVGETNPDPHPAPSGPLVLFPMPPILSLSPPPNLGGGSRTGAAGGRQCRPCAALEARVAGPRPAPHPNRITGPSVAGRTPPPPATSSLARNRGHVGPPAMVPGQ